MVIEVLAVGVVVLCLIIVWLLWAIISISKGLKIRGSFTQSVRDENADRKVGHLDAEVFVETYREKERQEERE